MDTKLKHTFMRSSSNNFPVRMGYSIFSPNTNNILQGHSSVIQRGFATTTTKSLPYWSGLAHDSPLLEVNQGQNNNRNEMGGLVSIIGGNPLIGVVQKLFSNFFVTKDSKTENMDKINNTDEDKCRETTGSVKIMQKKCLENQRPNIRYSDDEDEDYFDPINDDANFGSFEFFNSEISPKLTVIYKSSPETKATSTNSKSFIFSLEDFPLIPECNHNKSALVKKESPKRSKPSCYVERQNSLEDDEFVIFDNDSVETTPNSDTGKSSLKSLLISRLKCGGRQRQISECSDDSVVIFFESDGDQQPECWSDTDLSEAEEAEESDDESGTVFTMNQNQQPDSGFEEKKVRFCLKPKVHVMRTWDFAYRQARLGPWERYGRDRERFKNRIWRTEQAIAPIFDPVHRNRIFEERFFRPSSQKSMKKVL